MTADVWTTPLTPLAFLGRSAAVFGDKTAIVYGERRHTYAEFAAEATRVARALHASGVQPGDRVAYLLPNLPEMLVAHFAVPLAGAVLVAVNTRLASEEVRYILDHSAAKILVVDAVLYETVRPIADDLKTVTEIVTVVDAAAPGDGTGSGVPYADLLARGSDEPLPWAVDDERGTISINYTSGTTGHPKGVEYHHRGAYLNSFGEIVHSAHGPDSVYLWTLPMFHCNGWCTPWAVTAIGGTHVCLREVRGNVIWGLIAEHGVTHLNGAPTVVTTIMNAPEAATVDHQLVITTAGAPPSPTTILQMERMGFRIVHVYGLTETYGPYSVNQYQHAWDDLDAEERAILQARQGVGMICADRVRVVDKDMIDVARDGTAMGEIVMRGNNVMKGYHRDPDRTEEAFRGGWFHSGDLGVVHPDGYVELRDRAKDVVISGGENISTVEVEQAVVSHDAVLEAAVVGVPDEKWGEVPKAFVVLKRRGSAGPQELIDHVKSRIARYKAPKTVEIVDELPKTSTGKVQKFELREKEWSGHGESRIRGSVDRRHDDGGAHR
ncbi:acyl--CoA ligase family protein [Pseudonocardia sp. HH130629-09]|uniref:acyl--CoA ligase family protein n=1 Tax=Pseudonocardia sp. HH130629-09 TaxID=1641402 RepID=UPI0006CB1D46|nr:acyl--CoA ligase family protein [Pseudonocardia sp. HH130629-09]ALE82166.1 acyl-CoA synthetase [Pseudonocardia sp. HH130629-09]